MIRKDRIGWTGLMWAVRSGCALHLVVFRNNKVLMLLLYVPDIDVNIVNTEGLSGVHWAEFVNNIEALKLLLRQTPRLDNSDSQPESQGIWLHTSDAGSD